MSSIILLSILLFFTSCSVSTNEFVTSDFTAPTPLPYNPNLDNGAVGDLSPGSLLPPNINLSEKSPLPTGIAIDLLAHSELMSLTNLLKTSPKLLLVMGDKDGGVDKSDVYLFTDSQDPRNRQIKYAKEVSQLKSLTAIEKYVNYQLSIGTSFLVTDYINITIAPDSSDRIVVSIGGLSLRYVLKSVDSKTFTFESIQQDGPNMTINSTGSGVSPFFVIAFDEFKTIKDIQIYTK